MQTTVLHRLRAWSDQSPDAPAQGFKRDGRWQVLSVREFINRVFHLALFLEARGIQTGETGCILSYNCVEWVHLELALMLNRIKAAGLYPNSTAKEIQFVLEHTECTFLAVQNKSYWDRATDGGERVPKRLRLIIAFEGDASISPLAVTYEAALEEGKQLAKGKNFSDYLAALDPLAPAFIIYTSGTTGTPKGALISHDNLIFVTDAITERWNLPTADGILFSFLPLCHIAEQLHSVGVAISRRYLVNYCTAFENVGKEIAEVEPTLLLCVPRVWEKMVEGVQERLSKAPLAKKITARIAFAWGSRAPLFLQSLVFTPVKKGLGLMRASIAASGAAPLSIHVSDWFHSIGLEIFDTYGATEGGIICATVPGEVSTGTVGRPLRGCEVQIATDGEILAKGRNLFLGYFKDEALTKASMTDGWYHTGDLGTFTPEGLLKIIGRKKEIMKTSGGKMIAPVPIEEKLKEVPFISQVCLVGDNRKYLTALITLSESALKQLASEPQAIKDGVVTAQSLITRRRLTS